MDELISRELLADHGITELSDESLKTVRSDILAIVKNHFTSKMIDQLSDEQIAALEAMPGSGRQDKLIEFAAAWDMADWLRREIELVILEIAKRHMPTH
jgi:hypothetical protein